MFGVQVAGDICQGIKPREEMKSSLQIMMDIVCAEAHEIDFASEESNRIETSQIKNAILDRKHTTRIEKLIIFECVEKRSLKNQSSTEDKLIEIYSKAETRCNSKSPNPIENKFNVIICTSHEWNKIFEKLTVIQTNI